MNLHKVTSLVSHLVLKQLRYMENDRLCDISSPKQSEGKSHTVECCIALPLTYRAQVLWSWVGSSLLSQGWLCSERPVPGQSEAGSQYAVWWLGLLHGEWLALFVRVWENRHKGVGKESRKKRSESNCILKTKLSQIFLIRLIIMRQIFHGPTPCRKEPVKTKNRVRIIRESRIRSTFLTKI